MGIIAILSSPSSFIQNDEMAKIRAVIADGSGILHYEVEKHKDIAEALTRFNQLDIDAIAVLGDRALTSATFEHIVEKDILTDKNIPLAILPAGDNNIVAENFGATCPEPHKALAMLLNSHQQGNLRDSVTECPLIKLEGVRGVGYLYGLFFCTGEIIKQKQQFKRKISRKGLFHLFRNWISVVTLIQSAYGGALGKGRVEDAIRINRNQRGAVVGQFFMVLITTLDKAFCGVSIGPKKIQKNMPKNIPDKRRDKAHFISVENTPKAIMATGKLMLRGNYDGIDHVGNIIAEIQHARIVLQKPFVLDGSYYEADNSGELFVTVTDSLKFVRLS